MDFTKAHPNHNRLDLVSEKSVRASTTIVFWQLVGAAAGLEHLHEYGIVHGDLKGVSPRFVIELVSTSINATRPISS